MLSACSRPEIKGPADLISQNAKAVVLIPKISKVFEVLPAQYKTFSSGLKYAVDDSKSAAFVITSLDPFEAYIAMPTLEGKEEQLKDFVGARLYSDDSDIWSNYLFVAVRGNLPSRYGNTDFLPENKNAIIFAKSNLEKLLENSKDRVEYMRSFKTLRFFRNFLSIEMNKIFTYFISHDLLDFAQQHEEFSVTISEKSLEVNSKLKSDSNAAKDWSSMKNITLPAYPQHPDSDLEFSLAFDPDKVSFPLKGVENGLKSYFAYMKKPEAIFPMDTVFEKLRDSGRINAVGAFSVDESSIGGEILAKAEKPKVLHESLAKFSDLSVPIFFTGWDQGEKSNMIEEATLQPFKLFGRNFDPGAVLKMNSEIVALYYPKLGKSSLSLQESAEKGLFKAFFKPGKFLPFETGIETVEMHLSVKDNEINFKADFKK